MATAKKTQKATVRNPATKLLPGATVKKKPIKKKGQTVTRKNTTTTKKRIYKRNPANSTMSELLVAFGGALVINSFDLGVNYFFPTVSGLVRTGAKFGLGWLVGTYGSKMPFIKNFAPLIKSALWIAGALDVVSTYAVPYALQTLGVAIPTATNAAQAAANSAAPQLIAAPVQVQTPSGEMGYLYQYDNGDQAILIDERQQAYAAY